MARKFVTPGGDVVDEGRLASAALAAEGRPEGPGQAAAAIRVPPPPQTRTSPPRRSTDILERPKAIPVEVKKDPPPPSPPPPPAPPPPAAPPELVVAAAPEPPPPPPPPAPEPPAPPAPEELAASAMPALPNPSPKPLAHSEIRQRTPAEVGMPEGFTLIPERLPNFAGIIARGRPRKFWPIPPEWQPSSYHDKMLRAHVLRFWDAQLGKLINTELRVQVRFVCQDMVMLMEQTLMTAEMLPVEFLPRTYTPIANDLHSFPVRVARERIAYRLLHFIYHDGYKRVPPPEKMLRVIPDRDPLHEVERREARRAIKMNERRENWMSPKATKELMESAIEGEELDEGDLDERDEVPRLAPRRAVRAAPYPNAPLDEDEDEDDDGEDEEDEAPPARRPPPTRQKEQRVTKPSNELEMPPASAAPPHKKGQDPVHSWLPSGYKLRLWRKGEPGEHDVHLRDYATEALKRYASLPDIFENVVRPLYGPRPGGADVSFVVCYVNGRGVEGPKHEYRLGAPAVDLSVGPAGYPGVPVAPHPHAPAQQFYSPPQGAPATASGPAPTGGFLQTLDEVAQVEERMRSRIQPTPTSPAVTAAATFMPEVDELRRRSEMLELELMQLRAERQQAAAPAPVTHESSMMQVLGKTLERVLPPPGMGAAGAMQPQGPSFIELMQLMESQRASTIALMQSMMPKPAGPDPMLVEMLKRMDDRMERLEEAKEQGPSDIEKFVHQAQVFRSLMGIDVNGPLFKEKDSGGIMGVLKEALDKGPALMREYQNTMRTAAQIQYGVAVPQPAAPQLPPAQQQAQIQAQQAAQQAQDLQLERAARARRRNALPPDVRKAIEELLSATTPEDMTERYVALQEAFSAHAEAEEAQRAKIEQSGQPVPASVFGPVIGGIQQLFARATTVAPDNASPEVVAHAAAQRQSGRQELTSYLTQLLDFIGYGVEAPAAKVTLIVKALFDRLDAEDVGGEEDGDEDGEDGELEEGEEKAQVTEPAPPAVATAPKLDF